MWGAVLAALLVGVATGGWWSRRRAVAVAYQAGHATGEASALAYAAGGSVVFNGWQPDATGHDGTDTDDDRTIADYHRWRSALGGAVRRGPDDVARLDAPRFGADNGRGVGDSRAVVDVRKNGTVT